ncbi:hypothetical protein BYT27DRAFT_6845642 [Phlegmacium glaucopus]|nr:hypothetical protein BYT27DRAFT_6845642 [Phlegmacium glaucopus]
MHIVSVSDDKTVRIWNMATGECEAQLNGDTFFPSISDHSQLPSLSTILDGVFIHYHAFDQLHPTLQLSILQVHQDIILNTMNLHKIWIPPPFHNPTSICYHFSKICLGYATGEILLLEFQC